MKQVFLISGKAMSGKDSTANFLKQKLDGKLLIIHNADFLKFLASQYLNWNGKKDVEGRHLLQTLGTEKIRLGMNKPLYWVEKTCEVIEIFKDDFDYFAVPDVRFANEIYYPQARFPKFITTIRIERLHFDNGLTKEQKNHLSEIDLDYFHHDYYIESESGLDNLEKEVDYFIEEYTISH
jgi:hypothetical protein